MDLLFTHALFLEGAGAPLRHDVSVGVRSGAVAFAGGEPPADFAPVRTIDCGGGLLMPGLVNAHTHSPLSLLRSRGEGLVLQDWLRQVVWPYEARHTWESCYWGALLNAAECIRSGVTCLCDMYIHSEAVAQALEEAGLRALVTPTVTDELLAAEPDRLEAIARLADRYQGNPLIRVGIGPHAVYTCGGALLDASARLSADRGLPVHVHVSETEREQADCLAQHGCTPLSLLDRHGLVGPNTLMAHCVHLTEADIALARQRGATVVHCPRSNLKLGSGIAPAAAFLQAGIPVALGTDGSASNNNQDILEELRFAALLQKGVLRDPTAVSLDQAIAMATSAAGGAMGFPVGRLTPGAPADLILLRRDAPQWHPGFSPEAELVYAAPTGEVALTMVGGRILYENGRYATIDLERLCAALPRFAP